VDFIGSFPGALPDSPLPEVAVVGRSNVGKSSAINALLGRKGVARVSRTPGRTQTINLFHIDGRFCLADLPGYGFARVPDELRGGWKDMIEAYLADREPLALVVLLVDFSIPPQASDLQMVRALQQVELPFALMATKADRVRRNQREAQLQAMVRHFAQPIRLCSSETGEGLEELRGLIGAAVKASEDRPR
jgi:GTP-binding protein